MAPIPTPATPSRAWSPPTATTTWTLRSAPTSRRGRIVVCDRYVASSYVLQRMDGVLVEFIEAINAAADVPDLAVVLTADPTVTAHRIGQRGAHNRFEAGITTSRTEADLYRDTTARLAERGYPLLTVDTTDTTDTSPGRGSDRRTNRPPRGRPTDRHNHSVICCASGSRVDTRSGRTPTA